MERACSWLKDGIELISALVVARLNSDGSSDVIKAERIDLTGVRNVNGC